MESPGQEKLKANENDTQHWISLQPRCMITPTRGRSTSVHGLDTSHHNSNHSSRSSSFHTNDGRKNDSLTRPDHAPESAPVGNCWQQHRQRYESSGPPEHLLLPTTPCSEDDNDDELEERLRPKLCRSAWMQHSFSDPNQQDRGSPASTAPLDASPACLRTVVSEDEDDVLETPTQVGAICDEDASNADSDSWKAPRPTRPVTTIFFSNAMKEKLLVPLLVMDEEEETATTCTNDPAATSL